MPSPLISTSSPLQGIQHRVVRHDIGQFLHGANMSGDIERQFSLNELRRLFSLPSYENRGDVNSSYAIGKTKSLDQHQNCKAIVPAFLAM